MPRIPSLPKLLNTKIYKTGQTRGADDDVIYQNRVARNSTVLIPYSHFNIWENAPDNNGVYDNGFLVLIKPEDYFNNKNIEKEFEKNGLALGVNTLLFYETRAQWNDFNPDKAKLKFAVSRTKPLNGSYVARVPATTALDVQKILRGFTSGMKGAGIRVYEYASQERTLKCRTQLEYIFWSCIDAEAVTEQQGMTKANIKLRKVAITEKAKELKLDDNKTLRDVRVLNHINQAICPLCLKPLSANGFFNRLEQAEGRDVPDLTVTQINLFHIEELKLGKFNHRPYNLGWGHHHCNTVTKDSGIVKTLKWMDEVIKKNKEMGFKF
ncbi:MAG: BstXI family restriction endonuclease [Bacteroidia bacterium]